MSGEEPQDLGHYHWIGTGLNDQIGPFHKSDKEHHNNGHHYWPDTDLHYQLGPPHRLVKDIPTLETITCLVQACMTG